MIGGRRYMKKRSSLKTKMWELFPLETRRITTPVTSPWHQCKEKSTSFTQSLKRISHVMHHRNNMVCCASHQHAEPGPHESIFYRIRDVQEILTARKLVTLQSILLQIYSYRLDRATVLFNQNRNSQGRPCGGLQKTSSTNFFIFHPKKISKHPQTVREWWT